MPDVEPMGPYKTPIRAFAVRKSHKRSERGLREMCCEWLHKVPTSCIGREYDEAIVASAQAAWFCEREGGYSAEGSKMWSGSWPGRNSVKGDSGESDESFESEGDEDGGVRLDS